MAEAGWEGLWYDRSKRWGLGDLGSLPGPQGPSAVGDCWASTPSPPSHSTPSGPSPGTCHLSFLGAGSLGRFP